jgi:hypothetical protein
MTVGVILVAGVLTLPPAFHVQSADAKKYSKRAQDSKKAKIEAEGGNGGLACFEVASCSSDNS